MKAKDMFLECGYSYSKKKNIIRYERVDLEDDVYIEFIPDFSNNNGEISVTIPCGYHTYFFSVYEINAINKQIEELGWSDK